jgi:hypothetical protein
MAAVVHHLLARRRVACGLNPARPAGHDYGRVWSNIGDLIIKSLCSVQPVLRNNYRSVLPPDNDGFSCFEILGCAPRRLGPALSPRGTAEAHQGGKALSRPGKEA